MVSKMIKQGKGGRGYVNVSHANVGLRRRSEPYACLALTLCVWCTGVPLAFVIPQQGRVRFLGRAQAAAGWTPSTDERSKVGDVLVPGRGCSGRAVHAGRRRVRRSERPGQVTERERQPLTEKAVQLPLPQNVLIEEHPRPPLSEPLAALQVGDTVFINDAAFVAGRTWGSS